MGWRRKASVIGSGALLLAALSLSRGYLFPPGDSSGMEIEMSGAPTQIAVVATGHWRGEGMALVEAISSARSV